MCNCLFDFDEERRTLDIQKEDVIKSIYFICRLTQNQNGEAMLGSLSSKKDYIGGIFDRWINIIPESIIFNKGILPCVSNGNDVEVITDFYSYDPSADKAGIAPDVIGIRVNGTVVPFAQFNEKWIPVEGKPQIEIKTFKKADYMVSLRNQHYDQKYLVMVQSNYRLDYLLPFFDKELFSNNIYSQMQMDNDKFVISNTKGYLNKLEPLDISSDSIGSVSIALITRADCFMNISTCCESGVSIEWLKSIEECNRPRGQVLNIPLSDICDSTKYNPQLYRYNTHWYSGIGEDNIPYRSTNKKNGTVQNLKVRTLDFFTDNISAIKILKLNKQSLKVFVEDDVYFNSYLLKKNHYYSINYNCLERGNNGEEFFMQKDLVKLIESKEDELRKNLQRIIEETVDNNQN